MSMSANLLDRETSPYLLQHANNPVHWRPWGPEALAEAKAAGKPIMLSVGYAACHWCHVMARESFESHDIARLINELFIAVKVDREERPDIDAIYQQALALLGQQGGWPLTMFLTPEGEPFWGGTYFPPEARWGRAGFPDVLRGVARIYREERSKVEGNVASLMKGLRKLSAPQAGGLIGPAILDGIARRLVGYFDRGLGGLRGAPKFPNCSLLELMWRGYRRTGDAELKTAVLVTLDQMCMGGIYDHLGGGFARYSTDERWLVPHFEKMLYDNAQLIQLLTWAFQETGARLYRVRVEETVRWLLDEMRAAPDGAFAATIDADSEHEEGRYYVWTEKAVDEALGEDSELFKSWYDVTAQGNWEGKNVLNRLARPFLADDHTEEVLAKCRLRLLTDRRLRIPPARDDKVLADWNGLLIQALAQAAPVFGRADWLGVAVEAWRFVTQKMMPADRLRHSSRLGRFQPGTLDDHANMANAAIALYEASSERHYLAQAEAWIRVLERHFAAPGGGYYLTAGDTEGLITRTRSATDSAVPSGNGAALQALARLYALTGEDGYREKAEALIRAFSGELERDAIGLASYLNGIDLFARPFQIVIVGDRTAKNTQELINLVYKQSLPNRVLTVIRPGEVLPPSHPAFGKEQLEGRPTVYLCRGQTCSPPIFTAFKLDQELKKG
jgi:hypothetical protein